MRREVIQTVYFGHVPIICWMPFHPHHDTGVVRECRDDPRGSGHHRPDAKFHHGPPG
jgi:hypothetical protein